jgi:hypothetical protein
MTAWHERFTLAIWPLSDRGIGHSRAGERLDRGHVARHVYSTTLRPEQLS